MPGADLPTCAPVPARALMTGPDMCRIDAGPKKGGTMTSYALVLLGAAVVGLACRQVTEENGARDLYEGKRLDMVESQLAGRDITHEGVLGVMRKVPRHLFVPERMRSEAYEDRPLPIGCDQTISQPYIVAFMTQAVDPKKEHKVLEIGAGSGYQAAVLAELAGQVYTIEIVEELASRARATLESLGYRNVHVKAGDGYAGWVEEAPFDIIMLTAAPRKVPQPLFDQLKEGGVLLAPVGDYMQELVLYRKTGDAVETRNLLPVRFVPMTGRARE